MKTNWRWDWLIGFFVGAIIIEIVATAYLASNLGTNSIGVIIRYDPVSELAEVDMHTPIWWPGLSTKGLEEEQSTRLQYRDVLWKKDDPCFRVSLRTLITKLLTNTTGETDMPVLRQNQCIHLSHVPVQVFTREQFLDLWLPNFINWLGFGSLAIAIFFASPKDNLNRTVALVMGTTAIFFGSLERYYIYPRPDWGFKFIEALSIISGSLVAAALIRLVFFFPTPLLAKNQKRILHYAYAAWALITGGFFMSCLPYLVSDQGENAIGYFIFSSLGIFGFAFFALRVIWTIIQTRVSFIRKRMTIILCGSLLALLYFVPNTQAIGTQNVLVPALFFADIGLFFALVRSNWLKRKRLIQRISVATTFSLLSFFFFYRTWGWLNAGIFVVNFNLKYLLLCIPLAFAYVTIRYRSFRGPNNILVAVLILMISALVASGAAGVLYSQQLIVSKLGLESSMMGYPFPLLFSLFFSFGLLCSFQGSIWGILGRLIHRRESNYQIMKKFSEQLARHLDRDSLPTHITKTLKQTLNLSGIAFWEYDQDQGFILAEQAGNFTDPLPVFLTLPMDQSLLPEKPFRIKDQSGVYEFCSPLQNVENLQVGVCLVSPDTKSPLGFMSLGARDEEEFYGDLDLETLGIMAQQISLLLLVTNTMKERELVYQWAVEAEEHERRRIERELHDSISQYFHGQGKLLETINESMPEGRLKILLQRCVDETYKAAQELRVIINNLAYEQLQGNITQALVEYIDHFKQRTKMNVYAQINLPVQTILPSEHRIALYRVIRQALDNIATHAHAKDVSVEVCQNENQIDFLVSDDGCGFTQERRADAVRQHHFGLWSMEGRIQDLKGKITIKSTVGEGTQIQGYIPI